MQASQNIKMDRMKVVVKFHIGSDVVRKVWRFMRSDVDDYTRANVERAVLELYPDLKAKGLRLKMWYHDSLAGKVRIEGDADMQAALASFIEATDQAEDEVDVKYVTLHAEDCIDPDIPRKRPQSEADVYDVTRYVRIRTNTVASSPGPAQKSGKGPGVTCKNSRTCCASSLRLE